MKSKTTWGVLAVVMALVLVFGVMSLAGAVGAPGEVISNYLGGSTCVAGTGEYVELTWVPEEPVNALVNQTFQVGINAKADILVTADIERALFIVELNENIASVSIAGVPLLYDVAGEFFYWGGTLEEGFTMEVGYNETTVLDVTFLTAGDINWNIYMVQLPEVPAP